MVGWICFGNLMLSWNTRQRVQPDPGSDNLARCLDFDLACLMAVVQEKCLAGWLAQESPWIPELFSPRALLTTNGASVWTSSHVAAQMKCTIFTIFNAILVMKYVSMACFMLLLTLLCPDFDYFHSLVSQLCGSNFKSKKDVYTSLWRNFWIGVVSTSYRNFPRSLEATGGSNTVPFRYIGGDRLLGGLRLCYSEATAGYRARRQRRWAGEGKECGQRYCQLWVDKGHY